MRRSVAIGIGILVLILGMVVFGELTGDAVTGSVVGVMTVNESYFRVNDVCSFNCVDDSKLNGGDLNG